jgi:hypothetical protein
VISGCCNSGSLGGWSPNCAARVSNPEAADRP